MTRRKLTVTGPGGITIHLDRDQWFPDDPGQGTPAIVVVPCGRGAGGRYGSRSTLACVMGEGTVDGAPISAWQWAWLERVEPQCQEWIEGKRDTVE